MKPNRSIRLICRLKCVRALRGHGFSASVESHGVEAIGFSQALVSLLIPLCTLAGCFQVACLIRP